MAHGAHWHDESLEKPYIVETARDPAWLHSSKNHERMVDGSGAAGKSCQHSTFINYIVLVSGHGSTPRNS